VNLRRALEFFTKICTVIILFNQLVSTFTTFSFEGEGMGQSENYVNLVFFIRHRTFDLAPNKRDLQQFNENIPKRELLLKGYGAGITHTFSMQKNTFLFLFINYQTIIL
jgi:hypothetical protein